MDYVFYDTETTGIGPAFDQILQFAAIRTDENLRELERYEVRCRLDPHILPSIGAMLVTGLSVDQVSDPTLPSHFEMMLEIDRTLSAWSPATFIGHNTIRFDEEMLRYGRYRALLDPYLTVQNGSRRADTLRMARAFAALRPGILKVPLSDRGNPTFTLGGLCAENGLGEFAAHDALADVEATIRLARLLNELDADLFSYLVALGAKRHALEIVHDNNAILTLNEMGGQPMLATVLVEDPSRTNALLAANLNVDPADVDLTPLKSEQSVTDLRVGGLPVFRRLIPNRCPYIMPPPEAPADLGRGIDLNAAVARWRSAYTLIDKVSFHQEGLPDYEPGPEVEQQIYAGFADVEDKAVMRAFAQAFTWDLRAELISQFRDIRFRTLAARLVAQHAPQTLPQEAQERYRSWLQSRLDTGDDQVLWRTRRLARTELKKMVAEGRISTDQSSSWEQLYQAHSVQLTVADRPV